MFFILELQPKADQALGVSSFKWKDAVKPKQAAEGGDQEMSKGLRDGAQGHVVHTVQMEKSMHTVRRLDLKSHKSN